MLYMRFLKKFAEDTTFEELKCSVEEKKTESVEKEAHTLKGISLNLGLDRLAACADQIVKTVRQKEYSKIDELFSECEKEYEHVMGCLQNLE